MEFLKTTRAIKRKFGDIPFFLSKPFAQAYKIEEAVGAEKGKYIGSTPDIGVKTKDVERSITQVKEIWGFKGLSMRELAKKPQSQVETFIGKLRSIRERREQEEAERQLEEEREEEEYEDDDDYEDEDEYEDELEEEEIEEHEYHIFEAYPYATGYFNKKYWTKTTAQTIFESYWTGEFDYESRAAETEKAESGEIIILSKSGKTYHYSFASGSYSHKSRQTD